MGPGPHERDLFLHIIEMGCSDVCVIGVTGPLTGRVLVGNSDEYWGPMNSPRLDFEPIRTAIAWLRRSDSPSPLHGM